MASSLLQTVGFLKENERVPSKSRLGKSLCVMTSIHPAAIPFLLFQKTKKKKSSAIVTRELSVEWTTHHRLVRIITIISDAASAHVSGEDDHECPPALAFRGPGHATPFTFPPTPS